MGRNLLVGGALALLLAYGLVGASGQVAALHVTRDGFQLDLFDGCFFAPDPDDEFLFTFEGAMTFPADAAFFVEHGWFSDGWTDPAFPAENRRLLMSRATTFQLQVDGETVRSIQHVINDRELDRLNKLFVSEFPDGEQGTHTFTGMWFLDEAALGGEANVPSPFIKCSWEVTFEG